VEIEKQNRKRTHGQGNKSLKRGMKYTNNRGKKCLQLKRRKPGISASGGDKRTVECGEHLVQKKNLREKKRMREIVCGMQKMIKGRPQLPFNFEG